MTRTKKLPAAIPDGYTLGANIDISSWGEGDLFQRLDGSVQCALGYKPEGQRGDLPYLATCAALYDKSGRSSSRFVMLDRGTIRLSWLLHDGAYYRLVTDKGLYRPRGADPYFAVISRDTREVDSALTRLVFGGTFSEIQAVAGILPKVMGYHHGDGKLPRLTFGKHSYGRCDISGCLIPRGFPYVTFSEYGRGWSQVSLHGFFRLLSFLCGPADSPARRVLIDSGVDESVLTALLACADRTMPPMPPPDIYG